ncbi:MAG: hypothetical protein PHS57_02425 [Alphaproteobacteria bacterium]|nr:hypothetical protein [Alphaproteobacteria bacterium]
MGGYYYPIYYPIDFFKGRRSIMSNSIANKKPPSNLDLDDSIKGLWTITMQPNNFTQGMPALEDFSRKVEETFPDPQDRIAIFRKASPEGDSSEQRYVQQYILYSISKYAGALPERADRIKVFYDVLTSRHLSESDIEKAWDVFAEEVERRPKIADRLEAYCDVVENSYYDKPKTLALAAIIKHARALPERADRIKAFRFAAKHAWGNERQPACDGFVEQVEGLTEITDRIETYRDAAIFGMSSPLEFPSAQGFVRNVESLPERTDRIEAYRNALKDVPLYSILHREIRAALRKAGKLEETPSQPTQQAKAVKGSYSLQM